MNLNDHSVDFHYSFRSGLGAFDEERFVKEHCMQIMLTDVEGKELEEIGKVKFLMVYLDQALESEFPLVDILDAHSAYLAHHIFEVIDLDFRAFDEKIMDHYQQVVVGSNVCLIEKIQILPQYRGFRIGAKAIKDLLFHYGSACGLIMLEPYPLQFESPVNVRENQALELEKLEQDEEKATLQLMAYYQKLGFEAIEGIENLLFYNPAYRNSKLDDIDLEDCEIFKKRGERH